MEINKISNNTNFKSGLSNRIIKQQQAVNVDILKQVFENYYGIETGFGKNKSFALANKYCLKIFQDLSKRLNINFALPPVIFMYTQKQIIDKNHSDNFCIPETTDVIKGEYPFPGRSLFFKEFNSLEEVDAKAEKLFKNKISSSSHFLYPFIHEWLHSFHLDYIYKQFGYGGECNYMQGLYPARDKNIKGVDLLKELETRKLTQKENDIVYDTLGKYATLPNNQYLEIFSETFAKFICNSLDGIKIIKNPLEQIKNTSKEFQEILKKIFELK